MRVLTKWRGRPVGWIDIPVVGAHLATGGLVESILDEQLELITRWALSDALLAGLPPSEAIFEPIQPSLSSQRSRGPSISVLICTRERPEDLKRCLASLQRTIPAPLEVIVVDNAPLGPATKYVTEAFPGVRYVCEPRPGLDWARNRAILEARGDVVAFADDDVVVDEHWVGALRHAFGAHPSVQAVTGLIVPYELHTESQHHFELQGGFGRGFVPKWLHYRTDSPMPWKALGTGILGSGANMAFRRDLFDRIGLFLPELDTGTVTEGGGDLEMLYRTLKCGYPVGYEPRAFSWHRHRREPKLLADQLGSWGVATFAMLECVSQEFPEEAAATQRYGWYWRRRLFQRLVAQYLRPERMPRELRIREFRGALVGKRRYHEALERVRQIELEFGPQPGAPALKLPRERAPERDLSQARCAVRSLDITRGVHAIDDVTDFWTTRVFVHAGGRAIAQVDVENRGLPISGERLVDQMLDSKDAIEWLRLTSNRSRESTSAAVRTLLSRQLTSNWKERSTLPPTARKRVSVVLATCDRPEQLRRSLASLTSLVHRHELEVLVVDNHPALGDTAKVVREFPSVVLLAEPRQGLSYARNAGFLRARGDIIVCTDDDVVFAPDWLDCLLEPFDRNDIDIVCGNVLPMALDTDAQVQFEQYGGLGKGYEAMEVDQAWFFKDWSGAVETWNLGATANTAFRAELLRDPHVGLFDEALGPGVPSGVGEDTYFFYRALRRGYRLRYEPSAVVWHEHRRAREALDRQLFAYSKGHVAYHLHTLLQDGDFRALPQLLRLARWHASRLSPRALLGARGGTYPLRLVLTEIAGNAIGPLALWQSYRLLKKRGRSAPLPPAPDVTSEPRPAPRDTVSGATKALDFHTLSPAIGHRTVLPDEPRLITADRSRD